MLVIVIAVKRLTKRHVAFHRRQRATNRALPSPSQQRLPANGFIVSQISCLQRKGWFPDRLVRVSRVTSLYFAWIAVIINVQIARIGENIRNGRNIEIPVNTRIEVRNFASNVSHSRLCFGYFEIKNILKYLPNKIAKNEQTIYNLILSSNFI